MKILWVNSVFLHPTTRGGQIRTLEMLKQMHRRHEIHYLALADPDEPEGVERSSEYCTKSHPVPYKIARKGSPEFFVQLVKGLISPVPVVVFRKRSSAAKQRIEQLLATERFDAVVCDFLTPSINMPRLDNCVLFQHNVETMIWRRYVETSSGVRKAYMNIQARRMFDYERRVCRSVRHTIAVSQVDANLMRDMFDVTNVTAVATGVDTDYFARPHRLTGASSDLVFIGSMDYMPNIDGVQFFVRDVLPLIRARRPDCSLVVVGRQPPAEIQELAADARIRITGTVPDVRPYLWGGSISIVPLRVGGGTRLKIYESMAAGTPVVSTTVGAEGLLVHPPRDIRIADTPEDLASECLRLLENPQERAAVSDAGLELVRTRFSWSQVARDFEQILESAALRSRLTPADVSAAD